MKVSTPALMNTSMMSAIALGFLTCSLMYWSFASVVWLQPTIQLVPMIMRETDTPPTVVRRELLHRLCYSIITTGIKGSGVFFKHSRPLYLSPELFLLPGQRFY